MLDAFGLTTIDVQNAIQSQNLQVAAGQLGGPPVPQDQVFQFTLVKTPKRPSGGQITFGVSTQTKRTTVIGVPFVAFCE